MKIEVGKYYRTRDGQKVGPMVRTDIYGHPRWKSDLRLDPMENFDWYEDGKFYYREDNASDLIAEWTEDRPHMTGPVTTVTVKRIVPGVYGKVSVHHLDECDGRRFFAFVDSVTHKEQTVHARLTASELTAAIATLTAIRDAMEGGAQ